MLKAVQVKTVIFDLKLLMTTCNEVLVAPTPSSSSSTLEFRHQTLLFSFHYLSAACSLYLPDNYTAQLLCLVHSFDVFSRSVTLLRSVAGRLYLLPRNLFTLCINVYTWCPPVRMFDLLTCLTNVDKVLR